MAANRVLSYEIEIKGTERQAQKLNEVEVELARVRKERKAYLDLMKEGVKLDAQNSKALAKLTAQEKQLTQEKNKLNKAVNDTVKSNRAAVGSYDSLTAANARLTARLRQLEDPLGKNIKTYRTITAEVKKNEDQLKAMDAAMGRHQRNVGNYGEAIKGAFSQFGLMGGQLAQVASVVQNLGGAMKASVTGVTGLAKAMQILKAALISTGIGALVVAIGSLAAYFTRSEEGANKFRRILTPITIALGNLGDIAGKAGKVIVSLFSFDRQQIKESWGELTESIRTFREETGREIDEAQKINDKREELLKKEREYNKQLAKNNLAITKLRIEAADKVNNSNEERIEAINKAIGIEMQNLQLEMELSKLRRDIAVKEIEWSDSKTEALDNAAQAEADYYNTQANVLNKTKELVAQRSEATAAYLNEMKLLDAARSPVIDDTKELEKSIEGIADTMIDAVTAEIEATSKLNSVRGESIDLYETQIDRLRKTADIAFQAADAFGYLGQQFSNNTALYKASVLAQQAAAIAETIMAITVGTAKNAAAVPFPGNIPLLIGFAAQVAGLVNTIKTLQFAGGGRVPHGYELPHSTPQGDNTLALVRPGEVVLNQNQQAALGGANTFRRIGVPGFANGGVIPNVDTGVMAANALRNSVESIKVEVVEREIRGKATYAKVLEKLNRF